jgi:hypothetical protein
MNWIPCHTPIVADVIRWVEPIWIPSRKKKGKPIKVGEQRISAEVIVLGSTVELLVRAVEKLSMQEWAGKNIPILKIGTTIRRKKSTLDHGQTERLLWSEESVRKNLLIQS